MGLNHWAYFHSILPESFLVMSHKLEARAVGVASILKHESKICVILLRENFALLLIDYAHALQT